MRPDRATQIRVYRVPFIVLAVAALVTAALVPAGLKPIFFSVAILLFVAALAITTLSLVYRIKQVRRSNRG